MKTTTRIGFLLSLTLVGAGLAAAQETASVPWLLASSVGEKVWRIDDHGADNMYLVAGTEKAMLIDTGFGRADIMKVVRTLTPLPLVVVNTHGHPDHVGGNAQFAEVHAHPADFDQIHFFSSPEQVARIGVTMSGGAEVPEAERWQAAPDQKPATLVPAEDGYVFDLGGRRLEVVAVPGHTPGGICLLDKDARLLFTGDNDNTQEWMFLEQSTTMARYLKTLEALAARTDFDTLLPGHGLALDKGFIDEQIACAKSILDGSCPGEPFKTFAGEGRICSHKRAAIVFNPDRLR